MASPHQTHPIDSRSTDQLAAHLLQLRLVDTFDVAAHGNWLQADARGFHAALPHDDDLAQLASAVADRRTTGVFDASAKQPDTPVATVSSWPAELTVSPGRTVSAWAISSVTVAPTHRRRGIARALIEGELRTAAAMGHPLAALTVSESTIYERFGCGAAAFGTNWTIDTRRTGWAGPSASGRLHFVVAAQTRDELCAVFDRARLDVPGELQVWDGLWDTVLGLAPDLLSSESRSAAERGRSLRVVRYDDELGVAQGFAIYSVSGGDPDFSAHQVDLQYLLAASDDAYSALWRFIIEMDLVTAVKATLLSVDEPLAWQLSDPRAATVTRDSHLWLRILDVVATLEARQFGTAQFGTAQVGTVQVGTAPFSAAVTIGLEVSDPLDFTTGRYLLEVDELGAGKVSRVDELPTNSAALTLGITELSSIYLGGVSAATLVRAGRVTEHRAGDAIAVDQLFRASRAPRLSVWF